MSTTIKTDVLIIGAGPYGLSLAARLQHLGVDYCIVGESMGFWRRNMPKGMFLRSSWDWHLDPQCTYTIERYLQEKGISREQVSPFPLSTYLDYAEWFRQRSRVLPWNRRVRRLDYAPEGTFLAVCDDGSQIAARSIVLALGFSNFPHIPDELAGLCPADQVCHTLDFVDFSRAQGKSVLLIGGRQSAFEWAALLCEAGAREVHISHRHPSPVFAEADWSWVLPLMKGMVSNPVWFRTLPVADQRTLARRLWSEGRLKIEHWLEPRVQGAPVTIWPETVIERSTGRQEGGATVELSNGTRLGVDRIVLATGYKPDVQRVGFLARGEILDHIVAADSLPVLDEHFQSSVPGLYITSMLATRDFGPFFAFTVAAPAAAIVLGDELARVHG